MWSSNPTTATSPGTARPEARTAVIAPRAMRSEAAKMPSRAPSSASSCSVAVSAAGGGEVTVGNRSRRKPGFPETRVPAGEPVRRGRHVQRSGDGSEARAPGGRKVKRRKPGALEAVHVDVVDAEIGIPRPANEYGGQPGRGEFLGPAIRLVVRDHDGSVHVAAAQVADRPGGIAAGPGHQQDQLHFRLAQRLRHPGDHGGEERDPS